MIIITKQQLEEDYKIKDYSLQNLRSLGFKKHHLLNSDSWSVYRFPVFKYLSTTTLECEIKINLDNGVIRLDVYDMTGNPLFPFYLGAEKYNKRLISSIHKKILKEYKKLGIIKIKEKKHEHE